MLLRSLAGYVGGCYSTPQAAKRVDRGRDLDGGQRPEMEVLFEGL